MPRLTDTKTDYARLVLLFTAALLCGLTVACSTFPDDAKRVLDENARVSKGADFAYTIVSSQKATNPHTGVDPSYQEVWCVVTDKEFGWGKSRYWTIGRKELVWEAVSYAENVVRESYVALGCSNW